MAVPSSHNIFVRFESNIKDCSLNPNVLSELYEMFLFARAIHVHHSLWEKVGCPPPQRKTA